MVVGAFNAPRRASSPPYQGWASRRESARGSVRGQANKPSAPSRGRFGFSGYRSDVARDAEADFWVAHTGVPAPAVRRAELSWEGGVASTSDDTRIAC